MGPVMLEQGRKPTGDVAPPGTYAIAAASGGMVGHDVFIDSERAPTSLGASLVMASERTALRLNGLTNRGVQVWPPMGGNAFVVDHFCAGVPLPKPLVGEGVAEIADRLQRLSRQHRWMRLEILQSFGGLDGFTKARGEG